MDRSEPIRERPSPPIATMGRHRAACTQVSETPRELPLRQSMSTMFRDMSSNFSANDQRSIEVSASGIPQHHGAWVAVISQRGAFFFVCRKRPRQRGCRERSSFFPELGRTRRGSTRNSLTPKRCKLETWAPFAATKFRTSFISGPLPAREAPPVL